jgi:DNA repair protein RadC
MAEDAHYIGHRQRLKEHFLKDFGASFSDYELVELLLFLAQPRRDVKPLAKALVARFGSFANLIFASPQEIKEVTGAGDSTVVALKSVQAAAVRLARSEVLSKPVLSSWMQLLDYCTVTMAREKKEQFRVLFLNKKNILITDEVWNLSPRPLSSSIITRRATPRRRTKTSK